MARVDFAVIVLEGEVPEFKTLAGSQAYLEFEESSDKLLKKSMSDARRMIRQAAPVRSRRLQRSLRVSRIRRRRIRGLPVVAGYLISTGRSRKLFYGSITNNRQDTRVARWFDDAVEQIVESREFEEMQREMLRLFVEAIDIEFRGRIRDDTVAAIKAGLPKTRILKDGVDGFRATTVLNVG